MINSFRSYLVEEEKSLYFTFGRMNPPTIGHEKLMEVLSKKSGRNPYRVYLSQSQDKKKNPLHFTEKVKYARKMFPRHARKIMSDKKIKNVFEVASKIYAEGYKRVSMVVGSDRTLEFETILNKYNGKKSRHGFYHFENIQIISAGQRDPDADGAGGMSASKMRQAVMEKDFTSFSQGLPKNMTNPDAKKLYNSVRTGMGLKEQREFKNQIKLAEVSNVRENYVKGDLFKEGDKVRIKSTNEIAKIKRKGSNYLVLENKNWDKSKNVWLDSVEMFREKEKVIGLKSFKENILATTKKKINRQKQISNKRHDRMMDMARTIATNKKNKESNLRRV